MSERLQEAAELARYERRRRLQREIARFVDPGERVIEVTAGRIATPGSAHDGAAVRVAVTDRRLLVLRKMAFRQFAVDEFGYADVAVSLGFTAQAGGLLVLEDPGKRVAVDGVPEFDLQPLYAACGPRTGPDRVKISLEVAQPVAALSLARGPGERRGDTPGDDPAADAIDVFASDDGGAEGDRDDVAPDGSETSPAVYDMDGLPPDPPRPPRHVVADAQASILRWLVAQTGARAAMYLGVSSTGEERLLIEPRRLDADTVTDLLRQARHELTLGEPRDRDGGPAALRWSDEGGDNILLLAGARAETRERARFARFVIEWLDVPVAPPQAGPEATEPTIRLEEAVPDPEAAEPPEPPGPGGWAPPERRSDRPAIASSAPAPSGQPGGTAEPRATLLAVDVDEESGRPAAEVRLRWRGRELTGVGFGHTTVVGRHLAAARATLEALAPAVGREALIEHLYLTYPPMDVELVVVVVAIAGERFVGAAAVERGAEDLGAARAVLDALNRQLATLSGTATLER